MEPEIKIDETQLSKEMAMQAANFMYIAEQAVRAEALYDTAKFTLDQVGAEVDAEIRATAAADGKKITEKGIEGEVMLHARYKEARIKMIKAKAEKEMVRAKRDAWYQRKDMLVQMAIKERQDIDAITGGRVSAMS